jgi:AhpD family alkylhydroperoxidase
VASDVSPLVDVTFGSEASSCISNAFQEGDPMTPRINPFEAGPDLFKRYMDYSNSVVESGLESSLINLVEIRVSQINGCANCLNMHTAAARKANETEQRLHLLPAWREAPVYSERERAALQWAEHLTRLPDLQAPDQVYAALDAQFSKEEQLRLTMVINVINGWNRLAVGFRLYEESYGW